MADINPTLTQVHSRSFQRVLPIVFVLKRFEETTLDKLKNETGLSEKQIKLRLLRLQKEYRVIIIKVGKCFYVAHWGMICHQFLKIKKEM